MFLECLVFIVVVDRLLKSIFNFSNFINSFGASFLDEIICPSYKIKFLLFTIPLFAKTEESCFQIYLKKGF